MANTFVIKGEAPESDSDSDEEAFDSENTEVIAKVCFLFSRKKKYKLLFATLF